MTEATKQTRKRLKVAWLWGPLYYGLSFEWDERRRLLWLGYKSKKWKSNGW